MHDDELAVDPPLVRRLIDRDLPQFASLPVQALGSTGSTNALFRLGAQLLVRLPRQPGGSTSIDTEARWTPRLAPSLPAAVPEVVAVGEPGFGYPERWSVTRWCEGAHPATPTADGAGLARDLAAFVRALHAAPVPTEAVADPALRWYRSAPLTEVADDIRDSLTQCATMPGLGLDLAACREVWEAALAVPAWDGPDRWVHADLVAENLLVDAAGRLSAVLDFGALCLGDPAADLMAAWEVLDPAARAVFRAEVGVDDATWARGRGWALAVGVMTFPYYWTTMPQRCHARRVMVEQVLGERA